MNLRNRTILIIVLLAATLFTVYIVGVLYQTFINSPLDLASLVFIVAIYAGALYHHLQRSEG